MSDFFVGFKLTNLNGEHIKWIIALMKIIYFTVPKEINISKINILPFLIVREISLLFPFRKM